VTGGRHFGVISGWISGLISEPTLAFSTGNDEFFFWHQRNSGGFLPTISMAIFNSYVSLPEGRSY
jgi:hypothetical protein